MKTTHFWLAALLLWAISAAPGRANVPGGAGGTANVTLADSGSTVVLANGTVTATVNKSAATVTSMLYKGIQLVSSVSGSANVYFSLDGGTSYQNPGNCVYTVVSKTTDMVDVSCKHFYASGDPHVLDIDIHYVLRRGASGLYVYAVLSHPAAYAATSFGEWRMVWQLPHDATNFTLENIYVDGLRHGPGPTYYDITHATDQGIQEIYLINTGVLAGQYFSKYEFSADYTTIGCWGHASDANRIGAWVVLGSDEFLNDGPTKQDLTVAEGYTLLHFGMDHYFGSGTSLAAGEAWSKTFGPYLLYVNSAPTGSASPGADCWADAKAQVTAEKAAWPYPWLTTAADYPSAAQRGSVTGRFLVSDPLRPAQTGAGAWVGVSQPDAGGNWQFESKRYQYWAQAGPDGSFTIPNVRPGAYTFSAFVNGEVDEYTGSATVTAGGVTNLGDVVWNIVHPGQSIAWEIGYPDRDTDEFRHGSTDYFQGYLFGDFYKELPNPIDYTVGISNPATDWNYAQSALELADGSTTGWPWHIHFSLPSLPATGNATLTLAFAGNDHAHLYLYVNNDSKLFQDIGYPPNGGGDALLRQGRHAKYGLQYVSIPVSKLVAGANTITLLQASTSYVGNHVMYDYLNLEMPYPTFISGKVSLQGSANMAQPLVFTLAPTGATLGIPLTQTLTPAADGTFTLPGAPAGTYTLSIKGAKWLRKDVPVTVTAGSASVPPMTLLGGDLDGDNVVGFSDFLILRNSFNATGPGLPADIDGDGVVGFSDFLILRNNFNATGDP